MANNNKFGAFGGVFTPSVLTILGVIMYMRMGWVIGNAGLIGTILIVLIAHVISVSTGLSVSSVATDKKVGAGGIYYILSRSMGIPIGGSIGIALFVGTALSIALYLVGFAESFNSYVGLSTSINDIRITGSVALLVLTVVALISTSFAIRTQYFILVAIIASLVSIFLGSDEFAPQTVELFTNPKSVPLETVFAVFFPAVTGFTAGIAMSGDLKDPKRAIPIGTIMAIVIGFIVYISLAFFISYTVSTDELLSNNNILISISLFAPAVVAGIWGATLSSALGGILGGPRILQAMSVDRVTPRIFGKGKGKENEPVNALILAFIIAEIGILIGELDVIARVVSMFYLAAYGFINLSFYLESWANPDFQPTFKVKRVIGLIGFLASFGVMFKLDMLAMFGSIVIIMGIYFWLQRKQINLETGDVWKSVWENIVAKGLRELGEKSLDNTKWNPNIILFSGNTERRPHLLQFSKIISGRTGIVTNFSLIIDSENKNLSKSNQILKDKTLEDLGIFGRQIEVENLYKGILNVATTFGFSGIDPNTIMMGWSREEKALDQFFDMTKSLIQLDYNIVYLDHKEIKTTGKNKTIDIWWRDTDNNNAEMMLNISRLIIQSREWEDSIVRVLYVNHNNVENSIVKTKILDLVEKLRINAEIKIINNGVEQKSFYSIIGFQSSSTDLVILGIPNIALDKRVEFVSKTNKLLSSINATSLLVKASNNFNELELNFAEVNVKQFKNVTEHKEIPVSDVKEINELVNGYYENLSTTNDYLSETALSALSTLYSKFVDDAKSSFDFTIRKIERRQVVDNIVPELKKFLASTIYLSQQFSKEHLPSISKIINGRTSKLIHHRNEFIRKVEKRVKYYDKNAKGKSFFVNNNKTIYWNKIVSHYNDTRIVPNFEKTIYESEVFNFVLINDLASKISSETELYIENISAGNKTKKEYLDLYNSKLTAIFEEIRNKFLDYETEIIKVIEDFERSICTEIIEEFDKKYFYKNLKRDNSKVSRKEITQKKNNIASYGDDWLRNQTLAHNQFEAELNLSKVGISTYVVNSKVKKHIFNEVIKPYSIKVESIKKSSEVISKLLADGDFSKIDQNDFENIEEGINHAHLSNLLETEEENIVEISHSAPQNIELMNSDSLNIFNEVQNSDVSSISVDLANILDFIVHKSYLLPLQEEVQKLENSYNSISDELYNSANLLVHVVEENITEENKSHYIEEVESVINKVNEIDLNIKDIYLSFSNSIDVNMDNTLVDLNIRSLIETIDSYPKMSKKTNINTDFHNWFIKKKQSFNLFNKNIVDFVIKRRQNINTIKFDEKHNHFLNNIEQSINFIDTLSINEKVNNKLSFYYKKLFTGSHLGADNLINRERELEVAFNAVKRIDTGINGAIMVLGEALSGKTYFSETVAKTIMNGERVTVKPPERQNFDVNDLHLAFQHVFNKSGTTESIINQLETRHVFIFNDIEKWWTKSVNGSNIINYLAKIIELFGNKHYFILNTNIHSFQIIKLTSDIESKLISTIIMSPASKAAIKDIIMQRHRIADTQILFKKKPIIREKKTDGLFYSIYSKSDGNIGVALNIWIKSISVNNDGELFINRIKKSKFPKIINSSWKVLLYQFVIHNKLTVKQIDDIYGNDINEVKEVLNDLIKSGLILKHTNNLFILNPRAKHYIEMWLKELNIL